MRCRDLLRSFASSGLAAAVALLLGLLPSPVQAQPTLEPVITGLDQPVYLTHAPDGSGRVYIVEQPGRIRVAVPTGSGDFALQATPFLDISGPVGTSGSEMGLLGLAFHPDYAQNGRFFVNYTPESGPLRTRIAEYQRSADPLVALTAEKVILDFTQPQDNHNGGWIDFGPADGYLYIASGDGGGGGDTGGGHHSTLGNGQYLGTLLGKILRIDVNTTGTYLIPPDNPFISTPDALPEIYAYGLRNPWRCSFDRAAPHRFFVADVGQGLREEVNIVTAGGNYGWRVTEGLLCYNSQTCDRTGLIDPINDYGRDLGQSITGGYVARSPRLPSLEGQYIFGDFGSGRIWALEETSPGAWTRTQITSLGASFRTASFGEDEAGNIYLCDRAGRILRLQEPIETQARTFSFYD